MNETPTSPKRDAMAEVILCHREIGAAVHCAGCDWESDGSGPAMESFTRHQLDAILTATDDEECPACGGWGLRNRRNPVTGEPEQLCLVCNGTKRVPGKPLIISAAVEAGIDVVDALVKLGVLDGPLELAYWNNEPGLYRATQTEGTWRHADGSVRVDHMDSREGDYFGPVTQTEGA